MINNALTALEGSKKVFSTLKYLYFTPWVETNGTLAPSDKTYNIKDIVGDTTAVEQDDNEVNEIPHEFSGSPLFENTTYGKKTFTTECVDFRNEVLKELFGWSTDEAGNAYAPAVYKPLYVAVEMAFTTTPDILVLPKVLLNSKAVLASMKTDVSRANISGTCYPAFVKVGARDAVETDMAVIKQTENAGVVTKVEYSVAEKAEDA